MRSTRRLGLGRSQHDYEPLIVPAVDCGQLVGVGTFFAGRSTDRNVRYAHSVRGADAEVGPSTPAPLNPVISAYAIAVTSLQSRKLPSSTVTACNTEKELLLGFA